MEYHLKHRYRLKGKSCTCLFFLGLACLLACPGWAEGILCEKAGTKVVQMICADAELVRLDKELSQIYVEVAQKEHLSFALKKQQGDWLIARNQCPDPECLQYQYRQQLMYLRNMDGNSIKE